MWVRWGTGNSRWRDKQVQRHTTWKTSWEFVTEHNFKICKNIYWIPTILISQITLLIPTAWLAPSAASSITGNGTTIQQLLQPNSFRGFHDYSLSLITPHLIPFVFSVKVSSKSNHFSVLPNLHPIKASIILHLDYCKTLHIRAIESFNKVMIKVKTKVDIIGCIISKNLESNWKYLMNKMKVFNGMHLNGEEGVRFLVSGLGNCMSNETVKFFMLRVFYVLKTYFFLILGSLLVMRTSLWISVALVTFVSFPLIF